MLLWLLLQLVAGSQSKPAAGFLAACYQVYDAVPGGMATFSSRNPKIGLNHRDSLWTYHVQVCTSVL